MFFSSRATERNQITELRRQGSRFDIALTCQQVIGAYVLSNSYDMDRHVPDLPRTPIVGGSSDTKKNNLAGLLRL